MFRVEPEWVEGSNGILQVFRQFLEGFAAQVSSQVRIQRLLILAGSICVEYEVFESLLLTVHWCGDTSVSGNR